MLKTYIMSIFLVISLALASVTSGRFIQDTSDERDKRQIGDLRAAEYLALIALRNNRHMPLHCAELACGLVDVHKSIVKRTMSDQRLAELQALIALRKGHDIPVGHGLIDPWRIGKRRKRSLDSLYDGLSENQRYRLLDIIMSRQDDQFS